MRKQIVILLLLALMLAACAGGEDQNTAQPAVNSQAEENAPSQAEPSLDEDDAQEEEASVSPQDSGPEVTPTTAAPKSDETDTGTASEGEVESAEDGVSEISTEPEDISVAASDGRELVGTFYPGGGEVPGPGVLLLHMNGGRRQDWRDVVPALTEQGISALALDMRGHGQTGGSKNWELTADDLERVWEYLVNRDEVDEARSAIMGASIGANMALAAGALDPSIQTVILLSPGLDYFGVTTDDKILDYGTRPVMIVASEEDGYAADSSRQISSLAEGEAELVMYNGAGHGTRMFLAQPELTDLAVEWLGRHLTPEGEPPAESQDSSGSFPLFDLAWDDRSIFEDGLITSQQQILQELDKAPVVHLDIELSDDLTRLAGLMQIHFTNEEDAALDQLYFHLYPNRLGGTLEVQQVRAGGEAVSPAFTALDTVMSVPLPDALAPGDEITIDMEYTLEIPGNDGPNFGLLASSDQALALAHFYPQLAVYDDEGWNIDIPPGIPDLTYADSAYYLVRLSAPSSQVIISSGQRLDQEVDGGRSSTLFAAGPVRDFYLASGAGYEANSQQIGETTINSYTLDSSAESKEEALAFTTAALDLFNREIGAYPFTELDVVALPTIAGGIALGIEYPGIVVINNDLYNPNANLGRSGTPANVLLESTIVHEVGHQYFYSTVGSDQVDEPWLDESLAQFVTYEYYRDRYGDQAAEGFREALLSRWGLVDFEQIPIGRSAGDYGPLAYSAIIYGRGPLFFEALAEQMGPEIFGAFLADYYAENMWGIATGEGLRSLAEEHCQCDLTPLFAEWVVDS